MQVTRLHLPGVGRGIHPFLPRALPSSPSEACHSSSACIGFLCILLSALSISAAPITGSLGTLLGFVHHLCHESTKWNSWGQSPESCGQSWLSRVSYSPWRTWRMCISIRRDKTQFLHFTECPGAKPGPLPLHFSFQCSSFMRLPSVGTRGSLTLVAFSWVVFQRTLVPSPELLCPTLMW